MDEGALITYKKMHACYCVRVQWGIGGLKRKFGRLIKQFDAIKSKHNHLFRAMAILTNSIHRCRMDFAHDVVGKQVERVQSCGWDGDY